MKRRLTGSLIGIWFAAITIATMVFVFTSVSQAADITNASDNLSTIQSGVVANHTIQFFTPTGVDASSDTIVIDFPSFATGSVDFADIDFSHGTGTGSETSETLAASAAAGVWGVSISGSALMFTAPTDAASGEVAASSTIIITIGTNASGGTDQITNPSSAGTYLIGISGTFGDEGQIAIVILDNPNVTVSAEVVATTTGPTGGCPPNCGGPPQDTFPPVIFNVQASTTSFTTAKITWQTDEISTSIVDFGHTGAYASGTVSHLSFVTSHVIDLSGLIPCATYQFQVTSADPFSNSASSGGYSFTMPCDTFPPVISNVGAINITDTSVLIIWTTNEPADSTVEFGLTALYGFSGSSPGFVTSHAIPLAGLTPNTTYHFRVISKDPSGNLAVSGDFIFTTLGDATAPTNVTLIATPGDSEVRLDWSLPSDPDFAGTRLIRKLGSFPTGPFDGVLIYLGPGNSYLDIGLTNGTTYFYGAFAFDTNDNFASGSLASATPESGLPTPPPPPTDIIPPVPTPTPTPVPTPTPTPVPTPVPPPTVLPPPGPGVTTTPPTIGAMMDVLLYGAEGTLLLHEDSQGRIGVLANSNVLVVVPRSSMNGVPQIVAFVLGNPSTFALTYDPVTDSYRGVIPTPVVPGLYPAKGQAVFTDGRIAEDYLVLNVVGPGRVYERTLIGTPTVPVPGAQVTLLVEQSGSFVPWSGAQYGQVNPTITDADGLYVYEVPIGTYQIRVEKEGYLAYESSPMFIDTNIVNRVIELIKIPASIEPLSLETPLESISGLIGNIGNQAAFGLMQMQEFLERPEAQAVNQNAIAPAIATLAIVNAIGAFSLFNLLAYLQLLFTQPALLIARRRRKGFGVVYNSLTKRPVDLAVVRLIHVDSERVVRSAVTDKVGRYVFQIQPGRYRIECVKPNFVFPSSYAKGKQIDDEFVDVYHGKVIQVTEPTTLTLNIPMDPIVAEEPPKRVLLRKGLRTLQHGLAVSGVVLAIITFVVSPTFPMALLALVHILIYGLFRRLALPPKPKSWGYVSDAKKRRPIQHAVVRIFDSKFNKLLETQVTDRQGRYGFLVGHSVYYVTGEADGYTRLRMPDMDLTKKKESIVGYHLALQPLSGAHAAAGGTGSSSEIPPLPPIEKQSRVKKQAPKSGAKLIKPTLGAEAEQIKKKDVDK